MTSDHRQLLRSRAPANARLLLVAPGLAFIAGLAVIRAFDIDRLWADWLYGAQGGHWALRHAWLTSHVLHEYGQRFSIIWGIALLALTAMSGCYTRLRPWRPGLHYLCIAVLASLLLVSLSKHMLALPCPWDLHRYGGDLLGSAYTLHPGAVSGCFPAGHAAGGYCLVALYFFARHYDLPRAWRWLLPAALIGPLYGMAQELRGAHFLSHDVVSAALCWFVSYAVFSVADISRRAPIQ